MPKRHNGKTGLAIILSLILNAGILFLFLGGFVGYFYHAHQSSQHSRANPAEPQKPIVQAVAIDQYQVESEIAAIKANRAAKKQAEIDWSNQLQQQAKSAENQQQQALKNLAALQSKQKDIQAKTQAQQQAAKTQLARLEKLQEQAQVRLNQLQAQQSQLNAQNKQIEAQLVKTQADLQEQQSAAKKIALQKQLQQEQEQQKALQAQQLNNEVARYKTLIQNDIARQWLIPDGVDKNLSCQLLIKLDTVGNVLSVDVVKSSGNALLDRSAVTAVLKASPLPVPQAPGLFKQFESLELTVKPEGIISQ